MNYSCGTNLRDQGDKRAKRLVLRNELGGGGDFTKRTQFCASGEIVIIEMWAALGGAFSYGSFHGGVLSADLIESTVRGVWTGASEGVVTEVKALIMDWLWMVKKFAIGCDRRVDVMASQI